MISDEGEEFFVGDVQWGELALQQIDNLPTENSVGNIKNSVGN